MTQRQIIYVLAPVGHGGQHFTYSLHRAMGYDYLDLVQGKGEWHLTQKPDAPNSQAISTVQWLLDKHALGNPEKTWINWQTFCGYIDEAKDKDKWIFQGSVNTAFIYNEYRKGFQYASPDASTITLLLDATRFFIAHNIQRDPKPWEPMRDNLTLQGVYRIDLAQFHKTGEFAAQDAIFEDIDVKALWYDVDKWFKFCLANSKKIV